MIADLHRAAAVAERAAARARAWRAAEDRGATSCGARSAWATRSRWPRRRGAATTCTCAPTRAPRRRHDGARPLRFVLALDDDLEPFHRAHRSHPLLAASSRRGRSCACCASRSRSRRWRGRSIEQLIDTQRAGDIAWTLTRRHGTRHPEGPVGGPAAGRVGQRRALEAAGLAPTQSRTLARVALAVARGSSTRRRTTSAACTRSPASVSGPSLTSTSSGAAL